MRRPRARHLVLVVAGAAAVGSGLVVLSTPPRVDAPDIAAPSAPATAPTVVPAAPPVPATPVPTTPAPQPPVAAAPVAVTLPGSADVPLLPVGVLDTGALELPDRPAELGWFAAGAVPGDPAGTAVVAGHIDSAEYGSGPLEALVHLAEGDVVEVTDAAGGVHRYAVTSRWSVPKPELPADVFRTDGPPQLALITCGGTFDERTGGYSDNVVVLAQPVG
ncbi:class F sortase [Geodermatophilus sp. SYSU D00691]